MPRSHMYDRAYPRTEKQGIVFPLLFQKSRSEREFISETYYDKNFTPSGHYAKTQIQRPRNTLAEGPSRSKAHEARSAHPGFKRIPVTSRTPRGAHKLGSGLLRHTKRGSPAITGRPSTLSLVRSVIRAWWFPIDYMRPAALCARARAYTNITASPRDSDRDMRRPRVAGFVIPLPSNATERICVCELVVELSFVRGFWCFGYRCLRLIRDCLALF